MPDAPAILVEGLDVVDQDEVSAFTGLALKDRESVQAFAKNQPISIFIEEMRSLALGGPLILHAWQSALWIAGIFIVFGSLAVRTYRRV